jgi:hypothetical protein
VEVVGSLVDACVTYDRWCWNRLLRARRLVKVLTVEVVGSSTVSCVPWVRGGCILLRSARQRENRLSMGVIGSSVTYCIECFVVTATVAPER